MAPCRGDDGCQSRESCTRHPPGRRGPTGMETLPRPFGDMRGASGTPRPAVHRTAFHRRGKEGGVSRQVAIASNFLKGSNSAVAPREHALLVKPETRAPCTGPRGHRVKGQRSPPTFAGVTMILSCVSGESLSFRDLPQGQAAGRRLGVVRGANVGVGLPI